MRRYLLPLVMLPLLASCVAPQPAAPTLVAPPPAPAPAPAPVTPPVADRHAGDWSVDPLSTGEWQRRTSANSISAVFVDQHGEAAAVIGCTGTDLSIARFMPAPAGAGATLSVRTSFARRDLPATVSSGSSPSIYATLSARDPLWDQIIYSRGRFLIEASGTSPIIAPTRPEIARVVEDCRR